jgi:hypothetical protein
MTLGMGTERRSAILAVSWAAVRAPMVVISGPRK